MPEHKPLGRPKFAVPGMDVPLAEEAEPGFPPPVALKGNIALSFNSILQLLPKELHGKASAGGATYQLPKNVAMEQLSRGAIKVAFGDLRRAAPAGLFAGGSSQDSRLVDLPLREVLKQMGPEAFARRPAHRIDVPKEVTDLFGSKGERLTELRVMDKSEVKPTAVVSRAPTAVEPQVPPAMSTRAPEAPAASAAGCAPIRVAPALAQQLQSSTQASGAKRFSGFQAAPKPPAASAAGSAPVAPRLPPAGAPSMSAVPKAPAASAARCAPNAVKLPAQPAEAGESGGTFSVSIGTVSQKWPKAILAMVRQLRATDLEIPNGLIEAALKSGRIEFQWQQVATWLRPAPEGHVPLEEASTLLELPLSVVAPLFLQRNKYKTKKSSVPKGIPDLFSNKGDKLNQPQWADEAEAGVAAEEEQEEAQAPAAVPAFSPEPAASCARSGATSLAQLFGEPTKKNWTPNEIVQKTITMQGITGALIALQDGLLVAGSMPEPWKTETIAAFIPQIFGRLTQYTKELQMGEVKTVSFGVDGGTLQIFNAGIIYFGALGNPGSGLPVEDLTLIASELSRHTR